MQSKINRQQTPELGPWIRSIAKEIVENPTRAMQATFESLSSAHQWALYSLLDCDSLEVRRDDLERRYEELCPSDAAKPFGAVIDQLTEAFVTIRDTRIVTWIHPTCRDLAIVNLAADHVRKRRFLELCSIEGLRLALSTGGGAFGHLATPLLKTSDDWTCVARSPRWRTRAAVNLLRITLNHLGAHPSTRDAYKNLRGIARDIVCKYRLESRVITQADVVIMLGIKKHLDEQLWIPGIAETIRETCETIIDLSDSDTAWDEEQAVEDLADLVEALSSADARLARAVFQTTLFHDACTRLAAHGAHWAAQVGHYEPDDVDECRELADQIEGLAQSYRQIGNVIAAYLGGDLGLLDCASDFESEAEALNDSANSKTIDDPDDTPEASAGHSGKDSDAFVRDIFSDL